MLSPVLFRARPSLKLAPDVAQHDLILQVIGVALPENSRATVGDGLQGALRRSGYQTLFTVTARGTLVSGLMSLSYALLTLDGPSWDLENNELARQVIPWRYGTISTGSRSIFLRALGIMILNPHVYSVHTASYTAEYFWDGLGEDKLGETIEISVDFTDF
ncbi:hypothetical protein AB9B96_24680, partial [Escherichia coli]